MQTRMQIVNPTPAAMYTGITNAVAQISSTEGVRSLWRGIASVAVGAGMSPMNQWTGMGWRFEY